MLFEGIEKLQKKYDIEIPNEYNDFILRTEMPDYYGKKIKLNNQEYEIGHFLKMGDVSQGEFYNIFESIVFEKCPKSKKLKTQMSALGADVVMMSGSGPSVFGIFKTEEEARLAKNKLIELGYRAYFAKSV